MLGRFASSAFSSAFTLFAFESLLYRFIAYFPKSAAHKGDVDITDAPIMSDPAAHGLPRTWPTIWSRNGTLAEAV